MYPDNSNTSAQSGNSLKSGDIAGRDINRNYNFVSNTQRSTFLDRLYYKLNQEEQLTPQNEYGIIEELLHYKTNKDTVLIGLEKKLENGGRQQFSEFAIAAKEKFTKKLLKHEYSETAQEIFAFLLAKVYSNFQHFVYPKIKEENHPNELITSLIIKYIISPLEEILGENRLRIYEDEINGMIFFLTGNCHIKWN